MVNLQPGILNGLMVAFIMFPNWLLFIKQCKNKPDDMSKRFVSIWFPYLLTDWHERKQPHLRDKPFVLKAAVHNRIIITAANSLARSQGIRNNMVLADAKA